MFLKKIILTLKTCNAICWASDTQRLNPDALWRFSEKDTKELCQLQQIVLHQALFSLRENGHLVYATCSWNHNENKKQIEQFLQSHRGFSLVLSKTNHAGLTGFERGYYMFVAVMKRG